MTTKREVYEFFKFHGIKVPDTYEKFIETIEEALSRGEGGIKVNDSKTDYFNPLGRRAEILSYYLINQQVGKDIYDQVGQLMMKGFEQHIESPFIYRKVKKGLYDNLFR